MHMAKKDWTWNFSFGRYSVHLIGSKVMLGFMF
jgi:hypothetical protein